MYFSRLRVYDFLQVFKTGGHVPQVVRSHESDVSAWSNAEHPVCSSSARPTLCYVLEVETRRGYELCSSGARRPGVKATGNNGSMVCRIEREIHIVMEASNST